MVVVAMTGELKRREHNRAAEEPRGSEQVNDDNELELGVNGKRKNLGRMEMQEERK